MRHSNVATTMNVYGNSTLQAKQDANSKVVQMLINPKPEIEGLRQAFLLNVGLRNFRKSVSC